MAHNAFGYLFRITTWGESHGKAIGVVVDGCPAGLTLDIDGVESALARRAPGKSPFVSPRKEPDRVEFLSGLLNGVTTGAPISMMIVNKDADSRSYTEVETLLRPCHAQYTYQKKYGIFDAKGGGRASARETACRVAAGAIAQQVLRHFGIETTAYLHQVGDVVAQNVPDDLFALRAAMEGSALFCPDQEASQKMESLLTQVISEGDSMGGIVAFLAQGVPVGLGEPIYNKLEAELAYAMLSIPAVKGFEIGSGFSCGSQKGSEHNDLFMPGTEPTKENITFATNHSGGILAGISTGQQITGKVACKPTSSIRKPQATCTQEGEPAMFCWPEGARHDPCIAIRAVPVVEAMLAIVLLDALLMNRNTRL